MSACRDVASAGPCWPRFTRRLGSTAGPLLLLNTRRGEPAEGFYKRLGYREVGVVPGYSIGPAGERYDTVALYQELSG
jgi:hypothetical protein